MVDLSVMVSDSYTPLKVTTHCSSKASSIVYCVAAPVDRQVLLVPFAFLL
jgi:hypothetical protein